MLDVKKRKPIKVRHGYVKRLAIECRVGEATVRRALKWHSDTDTENLVRQRAQQYLKLF